MTSQTRDEAAVSFVDWVHGRVINAGRGDDCDHLTAAPTGSFWLGRLASEDQVAASVLGERGERLDPCAIEIRLQPKSATGPWTATVQVQVRTWSKLAPESWHKGGPVMLKIDIAIRNEPGIQIFGDQALTEAIVASGGPGRAAQIRAEVEHWRGHPEILLSLVNTSAIADKSNPDTHLYEAELGVSAIETVPFMLESLPDSFRYDRRVPALARNCGVEATGDRIATVDYVVAERRRPTWWSSKEAEPDFGFVNLATDPIPELKLLIEAAERWGHVHWSESEIARRADADGWSEEMSAHAESEAGRWVEEVDRLRRGLTLLSTNGQLLEAFKLANLAIKHASGGKYNSWRPFQIGFLLSSLVSLTDPSEAETVDVVWFATGGGKTETYLGLLCTAVLYDRMSGKKHGLSAWSRFPLRMLSLQQTQRFADALAGAELMRQQHNLGGDAIALGFFVGQAGTPNKIDLDEEGGETRASDPGMPKRFQVLLRCPFCRSNELHMDFNRATWTLEHKCVNPRCPWTEDALPFYVVDQEIYRFLPSVVVGTLDKAALLGMQQAMRGFVGAPLGRCDRPGHGFTYTQRSKSPHGCLVPGCRGQKVSVDQAPALWAPRLRLQDELHLLRDSLGAVDSHYEALVDHLQDQLGGPRAKVIASSATLTGYERQIDVLYQRQARVFPLPGPSENLSFWSTEGESLARRYVAIAPRGVTAEFVSDRILTTMQECVRELLKDPAGVCEAAGIDNMHVDFLVSHYGVDVVYGTTVRDVEAARRSIDTQLGFPVNAETLTGQTPFETVRETLDRLDKPESDFAQRIHVIAASSMMSHGVDIDRLNMMVMLGLPLTTAEFIQTTARVGRRFPGLVYVIHRIAREREASTFSQFRPYVRQGDRFVEPIPITRRSRRVLAVTTPGLVEARRLAVHEPRASGALTTVQTLRRYATSAGVGYLSELEEMATALGISEESDENAWHDLRGWLKTYYTVLNDPATTIRWPSDLSPSGSPMRSLRDVESRVPITEAVD